ncbi:ribbon-helix-helix domain-containing protein [Lichenibacterium ramalinae]|uniref:Aryl-sulfate sulfotransferase n=1 Tax=Lichenibacterium ramalinae TaxID=2316527 RepID=A0A4Q2R8L1_9HYPH|nr:ribbon-helix-helix domain-containing protein [Lichenibacterium ramalinae]RYB01844.1 aryl-sulfate sulfotransferase [Lichenibacterium ramalinae]
MDRPTEAAATVAKRSLSIAGHRTSVSLEDDFWTALAEIARARGLSLAALVSEIDRGRGDANLSSAIRVFALRFFRAGGASGPRAGAPEGGEPTGHPRPAAS